MVALRDNAARTIVIEAFACTRISKIFINEHIVHSKGENGSVYL